MIINDFLWKTNETQRLSLECQWKTTALFGKHTKNNGRFIEGLLSGATRAGQGPLKKPYETVRKIHSKLMRKLSEKSEENHARHVDSKEKPKASPEPPPASAPLPSAESIMNDFRGPLLMPCPACGKSVSKKADICVGCGHPIYNGSLGTAGTRRAWNIIFLFFLLAGLFSCLLSGALTPLLRF